MKMLNFPNIVAHFDFEGIFLDAIPYGRGHINDTYAARFQQPDGNIRRYILQRINTRVFEFPEKVMHNIQLVTSHLREKFIQAEVDPTRRVLTLIPNLNGKFHYITPSREFWRAETFVEGAQTYISARSIEHYYQAAKAFGEFQTNLHDFPIGKLHVTIPNFHHTPKRFQDFVSACEQDVANRAQTAKLEIEFLFKYSTEMNFLIDMVSQGKIPMRVTHNDTKLDNVMIDDITGEGVCVIDLDTVMPGLSVFDFGDTIRSCANTSLEDEPNLSKVSFDLHIFDRLAHGFLDATRGTLTNSEIDQLAFGAKLITLEQGMRSLTDYLNGDKYYKINHPEHNLERTRTQLKLVQEMETHFDDMLKVIERYRS